ncbi:MAG: hypothetical protein IK127_02275 [Clostridia bacterium]|nr:hypothetical protein [Clostridia bacterium]
MKAETERQEQLLLDWALRAAKTGRCVTGRFIPEADIGQAVHAARQAGVEAAFDGGRPGAERVQVCFVPPGDEPEFTGQWLEIRWNRRFAAPEHRALLGSLMALGIDRSYAGDLIADEAHAWLYCLPSLAVRLPDEWREAGRVAIEVFPVEISPEIEPPRGIPLRDTVPSLRLDAILASALRESRANVAERIRRGDVQVNHRAEERIDHLLAENDLLSIKGKGRVRLCSVGEPNRKGRLPVELELFLKSR